MPWDGSSIPEPARAPDAAGSARPSQIGRGGRLIKRLTDILLAGTGLVVLAPVMCIVAVAIRLTMGSPILFRQQRPGYRARPFELVKFRTMRELYRADGTPLPSNQRLTKLGYLLRKTSIDELPELWNILRGDMSAVGPRPLLMEYLPHYTPEQARRHEVRPGLTGLAQISGRHLLDWDERFKLDVWYVDHWSIGLDMRIMATTARQVVRGRGIPPASAGDYYFKGDSADQP